MARIVTLSEAASIGLHGMILIARGKGLINVQTIADATTSSRHHVAKVMQRLVKENYLDSQRGPNGGFTLHKPAEEISLLDIYEAIEGKVVVHDCVMEKAICPFGKCIMDTVTKSMTQEFIAYLSKNKLKDYL
jgi:Rrf2 family protein